MKSRTFALGWFIACMPLALCAAEPASDAGKSSNMQKAAHKSAAKVNRAPARAAKAPSAAVDAPQPVAADPVSQEHQLAVAQQVHTGRIACELGAHVTVTPDPNRASGFVVQLASNVFHMTPVVSSTGAVRLEDAQKGAMWLQLGNKSMLMNSKLGQRMADECQSPAQLAVAESLKHNPPPSLLDDPGVARK